MLDSQRRRPRAAFEEEQYEDDEEKGWWWHIADELSVAYGHIETDPPWCYQVNHPRAYSRYMGGLGDMTPYILK